MERVVKIQLHPTPEQAQALHETMRQFTAAFNTVCAYGWQNNEKNGVKLHHATYYPLREMLPLMGSNLIIQARVRASVSLKAAFTRKSKGRKASQPHSRLCPIRYDQRHTYKLNWNSCITSLSTCAGKMDIPFDLPPYSVKYSGHPIAAADLCYRKGRFWLHVVVHVPEPNIDKSNEVIGVDLGLNRPAVTSNRQFLGSHHWKEVDRRLFRLRRKLQSKGTKSAKRHLKKLRGKATRFHRDCDHVLSKRIVQNTAPGSTLVLENLTHIGNRVKMRKHTDAKRRFHSWSFAQFHSFLAYKAQERGIGVFKIDPRHTSQTCSKCGYQHRSNRRSQSLFKCRKCGYTINADLNASYNIRNKHLASLGTSLAGG